MENKNVKTKILIDLEMLNLLNAEGCPACGKTFSLGEMAVAATGSWGDERKYIHENEAVFDRSAATWVERRRR